MKRSAHSVWLILLAALPAGFAAGWPEDWPTAAPEIEGLATAKLQAIWSDLIERNTKAFVVIRNDRIVFERYATGHSRTTKHYTASLAKALVGGMTLMLATQDGRIHPDDPARRFAPQWVNDPQKSRILIRHLVTHTSGIEDAEADGQPHERLTGWKGDFWRRLPPPGDPFSIARDVAPVLDPPGTRARYSNPGIAMLAYCITASIRGAADADLRSLLQHRVMAPLGVPDNEWSIGYGGATALDGMNVVAAWGGGAFSPNAAARVGRLLLQRGSWEGRSLIPATIVDAATRHAGLPNHSGLGWWVNRETDGSRHWPAAPVDGFWGAGAGHQFLFVVPSLNLIVVRFGEALDRNLSFDAALERHVVAPLMEALKSKGGPPNPDPQQARIPTPRAPLSPARGEADRDRREGGTVAPENSAFAPYPPSPMIQEIKWAQIQTVVRQAKGGDNWPLTWADDDALYTAYGDGNGFEPGVPEKLSLGFARIRGAPPGFSGVNIRSPTGEQRGEGNQGRKASGILMVDGMLYLLARNAGNAQLAWSADRGETWSWSAWKFTSSFGCPTFLNFGRNYAGARDHFVYIYSHDSGSAYDAADRFVLARVPRERLREREAYEFFQSLDAASSPVWTGDIRERGAVFTNAGRCYRSGITYHAALKRYLWCQTLPGGDARFRGGFGIYDAPEPWGPWTTVYFTGQWDIGPGETSSFPTKWMNPDGRTLYLAFSGEDSFSVRKAELMLRGRE